MKSCFLFLAFLLFWGEGVAQPQLELVADINALGHSKPRNFTPALGKLFFNADYRDSLGVFHQQSLFVTDGTAAGTLRLHDTLQFAKTNHHLDYGHVHAEHNGVILFSGNSALGSPATDGVLWRTDGTPAGTYPIKHTNGKLVSTGAALTPYNGKVYFVGYDSEHGFELWVTNGNSASTKLVKDICPGNCSGLVFDPVVFDGRLFFGGGRVDFDSNQSDLWVSRGTAATTKRFKKFSNRHDNAHLQRLYVHDGKLYFHPDDGAASVKIVTWTTDGTVAGTTKLLPDSVTGQVFMSNYFIPMGSKLGMWSGTGYPPFNFYTTDGTTSGTERIPGITTGDAFWVQAGSQFFYEDSATKNWMVSDGTLAGTHNIVSANGTVLKWGISHQSSIITHDGYAFIASNDSSCGVWKTNGTPAGTSYIWTCILNGAWTNSKPDFKAKELVSYNGHVYLATIIDSTVGRELYRINFNPTSIPSLEEKENTLTIIPNPATNTITIHTTKAEAAIITDLSGRVVLRAMLGAGKSVDVAALAPGMYLVKMASGGAGRFVKE